MYITHSLKYIRKIRKKIRNHIEMDNTLDNLFTSDRLIKDVDNLMNSLFWIEALKSQNAKGISEKLNCNIFNCS